MSTPNDAALWHGWYRAGRAGAWEKLSSAATYAEAWSALLDALPRTGGDSVVLPADQHPGGSHRRPAAARPPAGGANGAGYRRRLF
jgi:hypothetical protein